MSKRFFSVLLCLVLIIGLIMSSPFFSTKVDRAWAQGTTLEYTLSGELLPASGDPWPIIQGYMSLELCVIIYANTDEAPFYRAAYGVAGFAIEVEDPTGNSHMITAVPDGLPPIFYDTSVDPNCQDIGLVDVYYDGFMNMLIYDLSIDGEPVDQNDFIGPALFGQYYWEGEFPNPTSFSTSMFAMLTSLGFEFYLDDMALLYGVLLPSVEPVAATIRIKPETLNLSSNGLLTAFITLPEGYDVSNIDVSTVMCEGAPAIKGIACKKGNGTYIAMFNRQDLLDIPAGDAIPLEVTGQVYVDDVPIDFKGADTIRVIDKGCKKCDVSRRNRRIVLRILKRFLWEKRWLGH